MPVLTDFAMFPTDKGESVSRYVSSIIQMIRDSGVSFCLPPMGTVMETDTLEEALDIIRKAHDMLAKDANRIYSTVKFDIRRGKEKRMEGKIRSVEEKIGKVGQ